MIKSEFGEVQLTEPSYDLFNNLKEGKAVIDLLIELGLRADLACIFEAFVERYGLNKAFEIWYDAVAVYSNSRKGET